MKTGFHSFLLKVLEIIINKFYTNIKMLTFSIVGQNSEMINYRCGVRLCSVIHPLFRGVASPEEGKPKL